MTKNEYLKALEKQIERLDSEIEKLKIKSERASADLKAGYEEILADIRIKQVELRPHLKELRRVGDETWVEVKGGLEKAWDDLKNAVANAAARFK